MLRRPATHPRRPGLLHPVLALVLLLSLTRDPGHQHSSGGNSQLCYACHFTPDLGLAAQASEFRAVFLPTGYPHPAFTRRPQRGVLASYDARGPPLLS